MNRGGTNVSQKEGRTLLWTNLFSGFFAWFWILIVEYSYENVTMFIGNITNQLLLFILGGVVFWFTLTRMVLLYEFRTVEGSHKRAIIVYTGILLIYAVIKFIL